MINIVIPMAGRGQRFVDAGYDRPKPFIDVAGHPMIKKVVKNLDPQPHCKFIFLCLSDFLAKYNDDFREMVRGLDIDYDIIEVTQVTDGAACTVLLAEDKIDNTDEMVIANCDQLVLDTNFMSASINFYRKKQADGGILCFLNDSPKWSYCRMSGDRVVEVVEKRVVSNIATCGIYYYRKGKMFVDAAKSMIDGNFRVNNEFYIAPIYNNMICSGQNVIPYMVNGMIGLGTPEDLTSYLKGINGDV